MLNEFWLAIKQEALSDKLVEAMSETEIKNEIDKVFYPDCHNRKDLKEIPLSKLILIRNNISQALTGKVGQSGTVEHFFTCSKALSIEAIEKINKIIEEDGKE